MRAAATENKGGGRHFQSEARHFSVRAPFRTKGGAAVYIAFIIGAFAVRGATNWRIFYKKS